MAARRTEGPTPDLFTGVASKRLPTEGQDTVTEVQLEPIKQSPPRYMLPKDLAGALARLADSEIDALLATVVHEAERRGRLPAPIKTMTAETSAEDDRIAGCASGPAPLTKPRRPADAPAGSAASSLPRGQANAVRAAFIAGVKPSTIARQFGISLAAVRQVLATEVKRKKS